VPLGGIAKICGLNHKSAYEWRQRVFATVDGYQDCTILRGQVWIDETYINDTDLAHAFGQARKRGLSKQKLRIAVAIDACKYALAIGYGKPSRVSGIACALTSPRGQPWSGTWRSRTGPWSGRSKACTRPTGHTSVTRNTSSAWLS